MNQEIPKTFKAVQLQVFGQAPVLAELEIPEVGEHEVLIKVHAAPVNPSDLGFLAGGYPAGKVLPTVPGLEGSGEIVKAGSSVSDRYRAGTRVAFYTQSQFGTYGQYSLANEKSLIKLEDDVSFEEGASSFVNPVTVVGMLDVTKKANVQAVVHNAAASALGRMFVRYFQDHGIQVINIVRRQEQVDLLISEGAKIVLNQNSENFKEELKTLAQQHNATILFDPVGSETTADLIALLPVDSTGYVYGGLGGKRYAQISIFDLAFQNKTLKGFWLTQWLKGQTLLQEEKFQKELNALLKGHLKTIYSKNYTLDQFSEGVEYYTKNQTGGKILIRPN